MEQAGPSKRRVGWGGRLPISLELALDVAAEPWLVAPDVTAKGKQWGKGVFLQGQSPRGLKAHTKWGYPRPLRSHPPTLHREPRGDKWFPNRVQEVCVQRKGKRREIWQDFPLFVPPMAVSSTLP